MQKVNAIFTCALTWVGSYEERQDFGNNIGNVFEASFLPITASEEFHPFAFLFGDFFEAIFVRAHIQELGI